MRRLIVLAVLIVSACSSGSGQPTSPADAYVQNVRAHLPDGWSDQRILYTGRTVCWDVRHREDFQTIVSTFTLSGISAHDAGFVMGAAVHAFCPNQQLRISG